MPLGLRRRARRRRDGTRVRPRAEKPVIVEGAAATLLPASETTARREPEPQEKKPGDELNVDAVFAKLKQLGGKTE